MKRATNDEHEVIMIMQKICLSVHSGVPGLPSHPPLAIGILEISKALDALLPANSGERRTLADIIFAKLESGMTNGVNVMQKVQQGTKPNLGSLGCPSHVL